MRNITDKRRMSILIAKEGKERIFPHLYVPGNLRTDEQINSIIQLLLNISLFKTQTFTPKKLHYLATHISYKFIPNGKMVYNYGEYGDKFFIILSGKVSILIPFRAKEAENEQIESKDEDSKEELKFWGAGTLNDGDIFGDLALMTNQPRTAGIKAITNLHLATVDKETFSKVIKDILDKRLEEISSFFLTTPYFKNCNMRTIYQLQYYFKAQEFNKGNIVYQAKDNAKHAYMVYRGEFQVSMKVFKNIKENIGLAAKYKPIESTRIKKGAKALGKALRIRNSPMNDGNEEMKNHVKHSDVVIKTIGKGNMFGYEELIKQIDRKTTVVCHSLDATVFYINYNDFNRYLKTIPGVLVSMEQETNITNINVASRLELCNKFKSGMSPPKKEKEPSATSPSHPNIELVENIQTMNKMDNKYPTPQLTNTSRILSTSLLKGQKSNRSQNSKSKIRYQLKRSCKGTTKTRNTGINLSTSISSRNIGFCSYSHTMKRNNTSAKLKIPLPEKVYPPIKSDKYTKSAGKKYPINKTMEAENLNNKPKNIKKKHKRLFDNLLLEEAKLINTKIYGNEDKNENISEEQIKLDKYKLETEEFLHSLEDRSKSRSCRRVKRNKNSGSIIRICERIIPKTSMGIYIRDDQRKEMQERNPWRGVTRNSLNLYMMTKKCLSKMNSGVRSPVSNKYNLEVFGDTVKSSGNKDLSKSNSCRNLLCRTTANPIKYVKVFGPMSKIYKLSPKYSPKPIIFPLTQAKITPSLLKFNRNSNIMSANSRPCTRDEGWKKEISGNYNLLNLSSTDGKTLLRDKTSENVRNGEELKVKGGIIKGKEGWEVKGDTRVARGLSSGRIRNAKRNTGYSITLTMDNFHPINKNIDVILYIYIYIFRYLIYDISS